jgi:hypothetical protein
VSVHPSEDEVERPLITVEQAMAGEWIEPPVSYVDPARRFCAMTGRPIARRFWQVMVEGETLTFCNPEEAVRYATYPRSTQSTL